MAKIDVLVNNLVISTPPKTESEDSPSEDDGIEARTTHEDAQCGTDEMFDSEDIEGFELYDHMSKLGFGFAKYDIDVEYQEDDQHSEDTNL